MIKSCKKITRRIIVKRIQKAALLCASAVFAVALAACGNDKGAVVGDGAPNPNTVKSEQVASAADWYKAFDFSGMTNASFKMTSTEKEGSTTESSTEIMKIDGSKVYTEYTVTRSGSTQSGKRYYSYESGVNYEYTYNESTRKWSREEGGNEPYDYTRYIPSTVKSLAMSYNIFTFDSKQSAYVYTVSSSDIDVPISGVDVSARYSTSISVKIKNGKVAVIQQTDTDGSATSTDVYQLYAVGSTSVTLPRLGGSSDWGGGSDKPGSVVEPSDGSQVDETQWDMAISNSVLGNVTVRTHAVMKSDEIPGGEMSYDMTIKVDANNRRVSLAGMPFSSTDEEIVAYVDGEYVSYRRTGSEWTAERTTQSTYQSYLAGPFDAITDMRYGDFTYDKSSRSYKGKNVQVTQGGANITYGSVEIKFNGGYVASIVSAYEMQGITVNETDNLTDYGSTYIDLPDVDVPGDDQPSRDEAASRALWLSAFTAQKFYNCSFTTCMTGTGNSGMEGKSLLYMFDHTNRRYYYEALFTSTSGGTDIYAYTKIDKDAYEKKNDGAWHEGITFSYGDIDIFERYSQLFAELLDNYDAFVYSQDENAYIAHNLTISALYGTKFSEVKVYFEYGYLVRIELTYTYGAKSTMEMIDYGGTVVETPIVGSSK